MCGIAGFIGQGDKSQLESMVRVIHHRGPDDDGFLVDEKNDAYLGMRRLSIIDVAGGKQPIFNYDGSLGLVYNGEIYNYQELRKDLETRGCKFKTQSDTEAIIYAYQEYGLSAFRKLNGMFAIAIWDANNKRLVLVRDRLGQKPLYYTTINNKLYFASELKVFETIPEFKKEMNRQSFFKFFDQSYIGGEETIYRGVFKVPAGAYLQYENNIIHVDQYWNLPVVKPEKMDFASAVNQLDSLIEDAVKIRLMSEVPLGVFLSGGLDSSLITYYAQKNSSQNIKTYTVKFAQSSFDESLQAQQVARHLGTDHTQEEVSEQEMLSIIEDLPQLMDEPQADSSFIPTYWLSRMTKQHVTVTLGGDAGDELFFGYQTFKAWKQWQLLKSQPEFVRKFAQKMVAKMPSSTNYFSLDFKLKRGLLNFDNSHYNQHFRWFSHFVKDELADLIINFDQDYLNYPLSWPASQQGDPARQSAHLYQKYYLTDDIFTKVDRASMAVSLEARAPLADHRIIEFANKMPNDYKVKNGETKYILKQLAKNYLPQEIIDRPKHGFPAPTADWLRGPLKARVEELFQKEKIDRLGLLNSQTVTEYWHDFLNGNHYRTRQIWSLLIWQLWSEEKF